MSKTHELKILPEHFWPVVTGHKKAELRKNDRDFEVGDTIILYEWNGDYTGERTERTIVHIADVGAYLPGYVLLSINEIANWKDARLFDPKDGQEVVIIDADRVKVTAKYDDSGIYWCNHTGKSLRNVAFWTEAPEFKE